MSIQENGSATPTTSRFSLMKRLPERWFKEHDPEGAAFEYEVIEVMADPDLKPLYKPHLMPAFHRFPNEASSISRIVAAFGELEFILGLCVGEVLGDRDTALRAIFRLPSAPARIDTPDALIRKTFNH